MAEKLTKEQIIEAIKSMTVMELADLVKTLEEEFGVSAQAAVAVAAAPVAGAGGEAAAEEKTEFNVVLKAIDPSNRVKAIKAVKDITGLGLKEAKEFIESLPKAVKEGVPKEEAEEIKKKLEEVGGQVEIQ